MDIGLLFYIDFIMNENYVVVFVQTVLFLGPLIHWGHIYYKYFSIEPPHTLMKVKEENKN